MKYLRRPCFFYTSLLFRMNFKVGYSHRLQMYTPTIKSLSKLEDSAFTEEPVPALVSTEFVPWCAKRFTEPILDMIQGWFP